MAATWFLLVAAMVTLTIKGGNFEVEVQRGGIVMLERAHLQLSSQSGDDCKVQVVTDEPTSQQVGRLSPEVFDCDFKSGEVQYLHNGNPLLDRDIVMLRVYVFTALETRADSVVLTIRVVDDQSDVVKLGGNLLTVPKFYAFSDTINASTLTIQMPPGAICTVRLMDNVGFPIAGQLVHKNGDRVGLLKTSCGDFINSGLKYQHLRPPSPQSDYIPISIEIRGPDNKDIKQLTAVWLPVLIVGAVSNQPPRVALASSLQLAADRFVLTALTTAALDAEDEETARDRLVFNVSAAPRSGGFLTHIDRPTRPIASFTWSDLHMLKVAYQPPHNGHSQLSSDQVEFNVIDDFFASSTPIIVQVSVRMSETNAPRVSWNMGLDLLEGQSRQITWEQLQIVDADNLKNVRLVAVHGPLHGRLTVRGSKSFSFGVAELRSGSVFYHHSDDESTSDHIVFRISDGRHSIRHRFPINVLPKDDSPPALVTNMAVEVQEGGIVQLGEALLLATDRDSSDNHIVYQLEAPPTAGQLVRRTSTLHQGEAVDWFVQSELLAGQIFYQHTREKTLEDSFDFSLSDGHDPPNRSPIHTMVIHIFPRVDRLPVESPGTVRSLILNETDIVLVTEANLHFLDGENPGADLTYMVTQSCFSPTRPELMDSGRLFYVNGTMRKDATAPALKSFTRLAVDHLKVAFMPPLEDIGVEPLFVQVVLSVVNRHGGAVSGIFLNITVLPVDDQAPQAFTNLLRVDEGGATFLTDEHLILSDPDTQVDALQVVLTAAPRHGRLEFPGDSFTLQDLKGLHVRYIHDDSETREDEVGFEVTDGINSANILLHIQVLPVNDEPPQLSGSLRGGLSCDEGGRVQVTADYLSATDRDSDDGTLSYMMALRPTQGELQKAGIAVDKFSQQDLWQGLIYYVHTGGEIGPEPALDVVTLIISDSEVTAGSTCCHDDVPPPPVPLHGSLPVYDLNVTIWPVNNKVPHVTLGASVLYVDEGAWSSLRRVVVGASDPDNPVEQLTFHLETPPLHGFLENTLPPAGSEKSGAGVPVESFSAAHLATDCINYVQSEHKGAEPTMDQLSISVSDGLYRSAPVNIYIIISPTNDEAPLLLLANFTVMEGSVQELTPSILDAVDLDMPPDVLIFTVLRPPAHGRIVQRAHLGHVAHSFNATGPTSLQTNQPMSSFTLQQLRQGLCLLYEHDDSETLSDSLTLRLTDGKHTVERTNQITVTPHNDQRPTLTRNGGLEVDPGQIQVISSLALESEDLDSDPNQVFYILGQTPKYGTLKLKTFWTWLDLVPGQNFSQDSVNQNKVWYHHKSLGQTQDSFKFRLTDLNQNLNQNQETFIISIRNKKKGDITLQMTSPVRVSAGGRLVFNTDVLLASDPTTPPDQLVVTVMAAPRHGLLHDVRRPGMPRAQFTVLDVAAQRICYTHDNSRRGDDDAFSFFVSNGVSSVSGSLLILIQHGRQGPPTVLVNTPLLVSSGTTGTIGPTHLLLSNGDTPPSNLRFRVTSKPLHGGLFLRGEELVAPPIVFTQQEVNQHEIEYRHRPGSPTRTDHFLFLPEDGSDGEDHFHRGSRKGEEPTQFNVQVHVSDRSAPSLSASMSPSVVTRLGDGRHGIHVTAQHLKASDPGSPSHLLEFIIHKAPQHGYLENSATGGYVSTRFTQHDLNQRNIMYVLPDDVAVTTDSFTFSVVDPAGNSSPLKTLQVFWSRVDFSTSCFSVCRSEAKLMVTLRRSGRSQEPAYVKVKVEDGSAKAGKDFLPVSNGLIQFDPGVLEKSFKLHLLPPRPRGDLVLVDPFQTLVLVLQEVDNVVLGATSSASVQLFHQSREHCKDWNQEPDLIWKDVTPPPSNGHDLDLEVELIWKDSAPPPRGDVPDWRQIKEEEVGPQEPDQDQDQNQDEVWKVHGLIPLQLEVRDQNHDQNPVDQTQQCRGGMCYKLSSSVASCCSAQRTCSMWGGALSSASSSEFISWLWTFVAQKKPFWTRPGSDHDLEADVTCTLVESPGRQSFRNCSDESQHSFVCEAPLAVAVADAGLHGDLS